MTAASPRDPPFFRTDKPYVRWWWFNERTEPADIERQLRWVSGQGFGGVEIAWVYPVAGRAPGPGWLSPGWTDLVKAARTSCDRLGLGCDFTFGSLWPFGDSALTGEEVSQWFGGPSPQRIDRHWETRDAPGGPPVMNHLDRRALESYARRLLAALGPALEGEPSCLFCDSWEVEEEGKLWTAGFGERFRDRFGYRIEELMPRLDEHPGERYDYRVLIGEYALEEFYRPLGELCRRAGALSRVQCHGAPTDILAAYAEADVPESESLLFDPAFSRIAASAAAIAGKPVVSCEAFSCLYGWNPWPSAGPGLGEEKIGDLKLLADALAAHGVNRFIWHGMPFSAPGRENRFYATVHVGPDGALAPHIARLNRYLEDVSRLLREGRPAHRIACLLPLEDARMEGELPPGMQKPSARWWWELQHPLLKDTLKPWSPLWVTDGFLGDAECLPGGSLRFGVVTVMALVVDSRHLDGSTVGHLAALSSRGARIILVQMPKEPGRVRRADFAGHVAALLRGKRVALCADPRTGLRDVPPFLERADGLDFSVREREGENLLFVAHPAAARITYPMEYGASEKVGPAQRKARFLGVAGTETDIDMTFAPAGSFLCRVGKNGSVGRIRAELDPS